MPQFYIRLSERDFARLQQRALTERRSVKEQAAYFVQEAIREQDRDQAGADEVDDRVAV
jgi:hypothetical protein